ncbi:MAG: hypothetical protein AVDCRST_MAG27-4224, partial [uncultured Craurococcus sp.]
DRYDQDRRAYGGRRLGRAACRHHRFRRYDPAEADQAGPRLGRAAPLPALRRHRPDRGECRASLHPRRRGARDDGDAGQRSGL